MTIARRATVLQVVHQSEMVVTEDPEAVLVTYALGSCIGLTVYDPQSHMGGMIHCMLPLSRTDPEGAQKEPYRFADTATLALIQALMNRGASRTDLVACIAGGSTQFGMTGTYNVGARNLTVVRKVLWKNDIFVAGSHVGGTRPRSMFLHVFSGTTVVEVGKKQIELSGRSLPGMALTSGQVLFSGRSGT